MKKVIALAALTATLALVAYAGMGEVLASWQAPGTYGVINGLAFQGEYIWVKNTYSRERGVFKCTTTGTVVTEIAFPYPEPTFYSYGLTFDGEYLWTIYQYWRSVGSHDDYRKYTTNGSFAGWFHGHLWYLGSIAVTWDGEYIFTHFPYRPRGEKYTTAGSLVATFPMTVGVYSDMAYYKRQLWYYGGGGLVYGVTLNGSVVASFQPPGGSCAGTAFDGEYLWTVDKNRPQYVYKVDIDVVGVAPASVGRVKALFR
jgi:hypothetical protein